MNTKKRVILVARFSIVEPLGVIYLLGVAKRAGWDARVVLVKNFDFEPLMKEVQSFCPDLVGFSIWTGYHVPAFQACDVIMGMGIPVVIGGPHATFSTEQCVSHATWIIKGDGFRNFRRLLEGGLEPGVHFDTERVAEGFPVPDRALVYAAYPELGNNPIKSIIASVGCPFKCSYCYAPHYNELYGGFQLNLRPVADVIAEALSIKERYPVEMFFFQDDVFGFDIPWLMEFIHAWNEKIGIPWHCQVRLELTQDIRRLELFKEGGCTGITLAIESGNDFLRQFVLLRPMEDSLIVEGVKRIKDLGFSLRTEQILALPFGDINSDLQILELNNRLNPEIAWVSILSPYSGTNMGTITSRFNFFPGTNDDLSDTFFDRSVLHHVKRGIETIKPFVLQAMAHGKDNPLLRMTTKKVGELATDVYLDSGDTSCEPICRIEHLTHAENERYGDQAVILAKLFNWLSKVPEGWKLASKIIELQKPEWTWERIGAMAEKHLADAGYTDKLDGWRSALAEQLGYSVSAMPKEILDNPWYFCFFPGSADFAREFILNSFQQIQGAHRQFQFADATAKRWLYNRALYKIESASAPIATA